MLHCSQHASTTDATLAASHALRRRAAGGCGASSIFTSTSSAATARLRVLRAGE